MHIEPLAPTDELKDLLVSCGLPVEDITPGVQAHFFGIREDGALAAAAGVELYAPVGLLRSLAVAPACRGRGMARALVVHVESFAAAHGIVSLFLLTTSAEAFFGTLGYSPVARDAAPPAIAATAQFSGLCPASSALLFKEIAPEPNSGSNRGIK